MAELRKRPAGRPAQRKSTRVHVPRQLREARLAKARSERRSDWPVWLRPLLGLLLLAFIVAFIRDFHAHSTGSGQRTLRPQAETEEEVQQDIQRIRRGMENPPYEDPAGRFRVVAPAGWAVRVPGGPRGQYDVSFEGPQGAALSIQTHRTDGETQQDLRDRLEERQRSLGLNMNIEALRMSGRFVLQRTLNLKLHRVYAIDFMHEGTAHHLVFTAYNQYFETYLPVLQEIMRTYEPLSHHLTQGRDR